MIVPAPPPAAEQDFSDMERSLRRPRSLFSWAMSMLTGAMTIFALVPLLSVLYLLITRGGRQLGLAAFRELPPAALAPGGGFGNAAVGTLVMIAIAAAISVPFGILAAIFIAEFGADTRTARVVQFCAKVMTGLPSILAGVFAYAAVVLLTADEAIKRVPQQMREAAIGMGATPTQVVLRVVLPTALPGVSTGVMLAVARAAGETAPLLFTALFSDYWISRSTPEFLPKTIGELMKPTASLAVLIYNFSGSPFDNQIELAWAAALVLVAMVLMVNIGGRILARRSG